MRRLLVRMLAAIALLTGAAACVIADPQPYAHGLLQPAYNHAWNNAVDAMKDEGVRVVTADLARGRLEGRRGKVTITGYVVTQRLGDVRAEFEASGEVSEDPELAQRVRERWDARMAKR